MNWAKALLLVAVLVVIGVAILAHSSSTKSTSAGTPASVAASTSTTTLPTSTTTLALLPPSEVKVLVLNGASPGEPLASEWSAKLDAKGYTTEPPNNATATVSASAIYVVTPGYVAEAQQLAQVIGDPSLPIDQTITSAAPIPSGGTATANLILVIGPDLAASA